MHKRCNYPTKNKPSFSRCFTYLFASAENAARRSPPVCQDLEKRTMDSHIYICTILSYTHTERKTRARTVESEFRNRINNVERRGFGAMRARSYFFFSFPRYSRYIRISKHYHIIKNRSRKRGGGRGGSRMGKYSTRLALGQAIKRSSGLRTIQFSGRI